MHYQGVIKSLVVGGSCIAAAVMIWCGNFHRIAQLFYFTTLTVTIISFAAYDYYARRKMRHNASNSVAAKLNRDMLASRSQYIEEITKPSGIWDRFLGYCMDTAPKEDASYFYFGIASLANIIPILTIDTEITQSHLPLISYLEGSARAVSAWFLCHKALSREFCAKYLGISWYIAMFFVLSLNSSLLVLICDFAQISVMAFILNLTIIGMLVSYYAALTIITSGSLLALLIHTYFIREPFDDGFYILYFKIFCVLSATICCLLAFLKPKQQIYARINARNSHFLQKIRLQQEELRKLLELKAEFLANLNHEIRTPLTVLNTLSNLLHESDDKLTAQQRKEAITSIVQSVQDLKDLTNGMLDLSTLSSLKYELDLKPINLSHLLHHRIDENKKLYLEGKKIDIIARLGSGIMVLADEYYLTQVLDHLITNAIKYTDAGHIIVTLEKIGPTEVRFSVADTGIGISDEELISIFRLFNIGSRTQSSQGGQGIGLALCKKIIEVHGGYIWAEHNEPQGAVFIFNMPTLER